MSQTEGVSPTPDIGEAPEGVNFALEAINELKGEALLVIDVRDVASFTDYIVLCNGRSDRHVQAVVDAVVERLAADDIKPLHTEGYEQASWVLIDFVDFLVNVFTPEMRDFYQLERVWRDAPALVGERPEFEPPADEAEAGKGD